MSESRFDAYHELLGIPPAEQPPNHYRLIGISLFENTASVIERAADRQMAHLRNFQVGKHSAESQRLLTAVSKARRVLLSDSDRAAYDVQLRKALQPQPAPQPVVRPASIQQTTPLPVEARTVPSNTYSKSLSPAIPTSSNSFSPVVLGAIAAGALVVVLLFAGIAIRSAMRPKPPAVEIAVGVPPTPVTVPEQPTVTPRLPLPPAPQLQLPDPPAPLPPQLPVTAPEPPVEVVVSLSEQPAEVAPIPTPEPVMEPKQKREPLEINTWVDLLPLIELDHDLVCGDWFPEPGNRLRVASYKYSRIRLPIILSQCSYDFEIEFEVGKDQDDMHLVLPVGDKNVMAVTDAYHFRSYTYLDRVAGKEAHENPSAVHRNLLMPNRRHQIQLNVRLRGDLANVTYSLNGRKEYAYEGPYADLQVAPYWGIATKTQPALAVYETPATFMKCRARLIEGEGFLGRAAPLHQQIPAAIEARPATPLTSLAPLSKSHFEDRVGINSGTNPMIGGKECTDYVYAHAPSRLKYAIPANAKMFTAMAYCAHSANVKFIVRVDDEELFTVENHAMAPVVVELPAGGKVLELECDPLDRSWNDDSCWCFPAFRE